MFLIPQQFFKDNLIFVISCLDIFAVSLVIPIFTQHLQSMEFSNFAIGSLNSMYSAIQFFSSPIIGHFSDVFGSKRVLFATLLVCSFCYPVMGLVTSFASFILIRLLIGFTKHTQLLCKNYIEEFTTNDSHLQTFGKLSGYTSLGFIVGPVLSGYVIDSKNGFFYMSCLTGACFALNSLFVHCLCTNFDIRQNQLNKSKLRRRWEDFFCSFKNIPWSVCWDLFLLKCLTVFAVFAFYINYSQSITSRYAISSVFVGYSFSLQGIIRSTTSFTIHKINKLFPSHFDNFHKLKIIYVIVISSFLCLFLSPTIYWYLLFLIPLNVCLSYVRILNHETLIDRTKNYSKGIILGAFNNVTAVARFLLPIVSGYVVDRFDYDSVYVITVVSLLLGILILSIANQQSIASKSKHE